MSGEQQKIQYVEIDIDGLAECLALDDWKEKYKNTPEDDLYELNVTGVENENAVMEKTIRGHFANELFMIKELYIKLIRSYCRKDT